MSTWKQYELILFWGCASHAVCEIHNSIYDSLQNISSYVNFRTIVPGLCFLWHHLKYSFYLVLSKHMITSVYCSTLLMWSFISQYWSTLAQLYCMDWHLNVPYQAWTMVCVFCRRIMRSTICEGNWWTKITKVLRVWMQICNTRG